MIPDNDFITNKDVPGPTKEEIRCLVICKSDVAKNDIVVDVGCGTGGLTVEFAKRAKKVYAIDQNIKAINTTEENLKKHNLEEKVELMHIDALEAFKNIAKIDILMIGGSGGNLTSIIEEGHKKISSNGKIIVTSILVETPPEAIKIMNKLNMKLNVVNVSISKGKLIERGTMMLANNPITIIVGKK
ncbi:MAG: precorrin-6Y C5,15-methyltransferase (decarboxylating) subunit CbiT [Methanobacterium sp.]|uniref:precorrin-6Y C5,15-methyltransferase (decarboxylating) subunit CbiT n=1 Tax=Methanobacterium sp. TaxID=2164 RepID=UPI003D64AF49|nr:precorrin-6Y C5,15-methyltransferase (decarboxylating) subunit CbiT [Methanobacterium sp.]